MSAPSSFPCLSHLALLLLGFSAAFVGDGLSSASEDAADEKRETQKDPRYPMEVDRSDPEAVRRAAKEMQEKMSKARSKKRESGSKNTSQPTKIVRTRNPSSGSSDAGHRSDTSSDPQPVRTRSIALLEDSKDSRKVDDDLRITTEIGMPKQGSLLERMRSVLAAKCLDDSTGALPYEPAHASVVELDVDRPLVPGGQPVDLKVKSVDLFAKPEAPAAPPESIEEIQEESERRFIAGLTSRDTVIRDWSFRYGIANRRAEAIPPMVAELENKGWLSELAATGLSQLGQAEKGIVRALEEGLSSKDAGVRQACVYSLGQLRAEGAVRPLLKLIRGERNYLVRSECCGALGLIGGGDAMGVLQQIFKSPEEPELVKAEAALALARHGDRSGLAFLEACFSSSAPQLQLLGLTALIDLREPTLLSRLLSALGARYDEVWVTAVRKLPSMGPGLVQPMLRETLGASAPHIRHRAALALGLMGDRQALPFIQQALLEGDIAERQMSAELLGLMGHRESIPLLMNRLLESSPAVRMSCAMALVRLDAKEALPAMVEAARGPKANLNIALSRDGLLDTRELMLLLGCIRALKGEEGSKGFTTMPAAKSTRWPEYEKELEKYQFDVLRGYQLVEVMGSSAKAVAVVLRDPLGQEQTYRMNEAVTSGYRVQDMHMGFYGPDAGADAAWVVLQRGASRVTLLGDGKVEVGEVKSNTKPR